MGQDKDKGQLSIIIGQGEICHDLLRHYAAILSDADRGRSSLIALDGGASLATQEGICVQHIIGDMDSLGDAASDFPDAEIIPLAEQDSNDFEKALYHLKPARVLGFGLFGKRFDQIMANLHVMAKYSMSCEVIAVTPYEIITIHKGPITVPAQKDGLVAIIPLAPLGFASSRNLGYEVTGLQFGLGAMSGFGLSSSNHATDDHITLVPDVADNDVPYALCRSLGLLETLI